MSKKRIAELRKMIKEAKAEQKKSKSLIYEDSIKEMQEELKGALE